MEQPVPQIESFCTARLYGLAMGGTSRGTSEVSRSVLVTAASWNQAWKSGGTLHIGASGDRDDRHIDAAVLTNTLRNTICHLTADLHPVTKDPTGDLQ